MAKIIILGTAAAISSQEQENTHLAVQAGEQIILVDCCGSPLKRLQEAGLDWRQMQHVILTHFHADHVSGIPNLLVGMWLSGRQDPLVIHGLAETLERMQRLLDLFGWSGWTGLFPVTFHDIPPVEKTLVLETNELRILASPTEHMLPAMGLRFESKESGEAAVYSSDTQPTQAVVSLGQNSKILIHEATGAFPGHSSPAQAAEVARQANTDHLYLIHYNAAEMADRSEAIQQARRAFSGTVTLAQDLMQISF